MYIKFTFIYNTLHIDIPTDTHTISVREQVKTLGRQVLVWL